MSNQDMQFVDPEWQTSQQQGRNINPPVTSRQGEPMQEPYIPRPINTDPREQSPWQSPPAGQEGYLGQGYYAGPGQQMRAGQFRPPERRRRRWPLVALLLIIILGLAGVSALVLGAINLSTIVETRSFFMGSHPRLVVSEDVGAIHVHTGGTGNTVTVVATKHSRGLFANLNNLQVNYNQNNSSNTLDIEARVNGGGNFISLSSIDLDITVPSQDDLLQLSTDIGSIDVSNVSGQFVLSTATGSITATNDSLSGQSSLTTNTGSITATQDVLSGQSVLKTDTGSITFDGSIGTSGSYSFQTSTGSINVTLPRGSAFHVDAATDTGSIDTDFQGVNVQHPNTTGAEAHGNVGGSSPNATVTLETNTGSIGLHAGL